jgi:hypothetical protein
MTVEEVKAGLVREPLFVYRGERDVSIIPSTSETLIEVPGTDYVERGYFQFHEDRLLVMIVVLARGLISYYEVYESLVRRYGPATTLDPSAAVWLLDGLRLSLERPVVLKYVDDAVFSALIEAGRSLRDYEAEARASFLEGL